MLMDAMDRAQLEQERELDAIIAAARMSAVHVEGAENCEGCGSVIPLERRTAAPGCSFCVECQQAAENRVALLLWGGRHA